MLSDLLCHRRADRPALLIDDRAIAAAELDRLAERTAAWLHAQGIGPGDRVAVWLVNRIEWLALLFGLARIGASLVAVNTRFRSAELEYVLRRAMPKILVLQHNFRRIDFAAILGSADASAFSTLDRIAVVEADAATPTHIGGKPVVAFDAFDRSYPSVPAWRDSNAIAAMFTTSGTTKGPKLVMHSQATITYHAQRVATGFDLAEPGAVLLAATPFCGVFGFDSAMGAIAAGAPVVMMDTFEGETAARLIREQAVTHLFGPDEIYRRLIEAAPGANPFPSARHFGFGALQPSGHEVGRIAEARGLPMRGLYGSSEVHALFSTQRADLAYDERIAGGGHAVAGAAAEVRIRDSASGALLPAGESGEIEIRAPSNFVGYFNDPEATARAIDAEGFFRTGDLGHLRADGAFVYETRLGDAMRLGGFLVSPEEIEETLRGLPGVADAQVVAIEIGRALRCAAFVIAKPSDTLDESALIGACKACMAPFKVPARVFFVDTFPTTPSANGTKIQRAKLREIALSRVGN